MKHTLLLSILFAMFVMGPLSSQAQIRDTLFWFKAEPTFVGQAGGFKTSTLGVVMSGGSTMAKVNQSLTRSLGIQSNPKLKSSSNPVVLRRSGTCYRISPVGDGCQILWLDRNNDGKVQPGKELRGAKSKTQSCAIRVGKISCN